MDLTGRESARALREMKPDLVESMLDASYRLAPEVWEPFGEGGRAYARADFGHHLDFLAEALSFDDPGLFTHYVEWVAALFAGLGFGAKGMDSTLAALREGLVTVLPAKLSEKAISILDMASFPLVATSTTFIDRNSAQGANAGLFLDDLLAGKRAEASRLVLDLVQKGMDIRSVYLDIFQPSQYELGRLWMTGAISVAQEHFCTAATQSIMARLYPLVFAAPRTKPGVIGACIGDELHEMGIRMVCDFLEFDGWDTYYLGANMPSRGIAAAIRERNAPILCLSLTMSSRVSEVEKTIAAVRTACSPDLKVLVGGYPFRNSPGLWEKVGADGFASDAAEAVTLAASLSRVSKDTPS